MNTTPLERNQAANRLREVYARNPELRARIRVSHELEEADRIIQGRDYRAAHDLAAWRKLGARE